MTFPAFAQTITGTTTVKINNTFGSTITESSQSCTGCSYGTQPPSSVSNNTTSSGFTFTATTAGTNGMSTTKYQASSGGHTYTCQFQAQNSASTFGSACSAPSVAASATSGFGGSPHCPTPTYTTPDASCNFTATFYMSP